MRFEPGGWWHDYVCPLHHTELDAPDAGGTYPCRHGCRLDGEPYAGAWLVFEHQAHARRLRLDAHRLAAGDETAGEPAVALLERLAELYATVGGGSEHAGARPWMLAGRLFQQALTEALWGAVVAHGVWTLLDALTADDPRRPRVERAAVPLLAGIEAGAAAARQAVAVERGDFRSNYTAWFNAAGHAAASVLARLDRYEGDAAVWVHGDHGQLAHLAAAIHTDGWEWEGATYYHVFVLRAYLLSLRGAAPAALPGDAVERLGRMLAVLTEVAAPDGRLPALHDSPYDRIPYHQEVLEVCALGSQLVADGGLELLAASARTSLGAADDGLERHLGGWLAGPPWPVARPSPGRSALHRDAGYAVLRSPDARWQALVDYGGHGGAHGHLDTLALYLEGDGVAWQPDPGVTPYGSPARRHYASTVAHPTFRVGGADQHESSGRLERWVERADAVTVVVSTEEACAGVTARRSLVMGALGLADLLELEAAAEVEACLQLRPAVPVSVVLRSRDTFVTRWQHPRGDLVGLHTCHGGTPALTRLPGPADDPSRTVTGVDWLACGDRIAWLSLYQPSWTAPADRATALTLTAAGAEVATPAGLVRVTFEDRNRDERA